MCGLLDSPEHKVKGRLLLNVVVAEGAAVLKLLASEDQALLVRGDTEGKAISGDPLRKLCGTTHPSLS